MFYEVRVYKADGRLKQKISRLRQYLLIGDLLINYPAYPEKPFEDILDSKILVVDDEESNVKLLE